MSDKRRRPDDVRPAFTLPSKPSSIGREVDEEIRFHLESRVAELMRDGRSRDDAYATALTEYGDVAASRSELSKVDRRRLRSERWSARASALGQDVAYALRALRRERAFTLGVVLVLAIGIGANATMVGVADRLLFRAPAGVTDPARAMAIDFIRMRGVEADHQDVLSYPQYQDLTQTAGVFEHVAAYAFADLTEGRGPAAQHVSTIRATAGYFAVLGTRPLLGRFFLPSDDGAPIGANVAVLSWGYWQRRFQGDASVLGRELAIGDDRYTVIGVAPRGFHGASQSTVDVWIPFTAGLTPLDIERWNNRNAFWLFGIARLAPGVSSKAAGEIAARVLRANSLRVGVSQFKLDEQRPSFGLTSMAPEGMQARGPSGRVALLLAAVSLLVLLIACANVANLQLARGLRRRREIGVRVALGVSRARLVQLVLTESVVLSTIGGAAAVAATVWASRTVRALLLRGSDWSDIPTIDGRMLVYTLVSTLAVGVLTGLVPALASVASDVTAALRQGAQQIKAGQTRARSWLLIAQAALTVILLVGTRLFVRSLERVKAVPVGMETDRVLVSEINTSGLKLSRSETLSLYARLLDVAEHSPEVEGAALASSLPYYTSLATPLFVPGRDSLPRVRDGGPYYNGVTPEYFKTMGIALKRGRWFTPAEEAGHANVLILNESLARLAFPNGDAVGRCARVGSDTAPCSEIVGIAADARRQSIFEDVSLQFFMPLSRVPARADSRTLVLRARGDPRRSLEATRRRLQAAVPGLPYVNVFPMSDLVSPELQSWRLGAAMFGAFGGVSLVLAMVGLYSMLAYDVAQRRQELGLRVALGATARDLAWMVVGAGTRIVSLGAGVGLAIAWSAGGVIQPLLFQTSAHDPRVIAVVVLSLLTVTWLAAVAPLRRAWRIDPMTALRAD
jgi:predicted permease